MDNDAVDPAAVDADMTSTVSLSRHGYLVRSLSGLSRRKSWQCRISTILFSRLSFSLFRLAV